MITKEQFDQLYSPDIKKSDYDKIMSLIDDRFFEIVRLVFDDYFKWFDYDNLNYNAEGQSGYFDQDRYRENIRIEGAKGNKIPEPYCYTDDGNAFIPTRWLWTSDKEILKEFRTEVQKYKEKNLLDKAKAKQKREELKEKKKLMKSIISSKLTKDELKYISFK